MTPPNGPVWFHIFHMTRMVSNGLVWSCTVLYGTVQSRMVLCSPIWSHIWLESLRKYIPISQMSPNHIQNGASPMLIFHKIALLLYPFKVI